MSADKTIAGAVSTMWGLVLDHLVDKHAQTVASTRVNPEGGVARTPQGVLVTSKELYLQVLLNADGNYTNDGYQKRMEQSFGAIFLGMDWGPEYEKNQRQPMPQSERSPGETPSRSRSRKHAPHFRPCRRRAASSISRCFRTSCSRRFAAIISTYRMAST